MAAKRELIEPHKDDKRYVRRKKTGQFKESDDVGRSLPKTAAARPRPSHREARATAATAAWAGEVWSGKCLQLDDRPKRPNPPTAAWTSPDLGSTSGQPFSHEHSRNVRRLAAPLRHLFQPAANRTVAYALSQQNRCSHSRNQHGVCDAWQNRNSHGGFPSSKRFQFDLFRSDWRLAFGRGKGSCWFA